MATRLYLRELTPTNDPGEGERSSALPVFHSQDYSFPVKALRTSPGSVETSLSSPSLAHTDHDDEFFTSFSSEALAAQTVTAQTWTVALMVASSSSLANSFLVTSVYVFREPSTVVGFIYDSDTPLGAEWPNNPSGRVATFSGAAVTAQEGDYIVFEMWRHTATQGMAMSYSQEVYFEGGTDVVEDASAGDAASYLETPQDLTFASGAVARRRVGFGGGRAITL